MANWFAGLTGQETVRLSQQVRLDTHLAALFAHLDINLVIDAGANIGQYGQRLRGLGYTGWIVSYEPLPPILETLRQISQADPHWIVRPCALGTEAGRNTIRMSPDSSWSSMKGFSEYAKLRFPSQDRDAVSYEIDVCRLDEDLPQHISDITNPRAFLKLDTQGFDLEAFSGAKAVLPHIQALQAEVAFQSIYDNTPRYVEAMAAYEAAGFAVTGLFPVKRDKKSLCMIEMDCVMRRWPVDGAGSAESRA